MLTTDTGSGKVATFETPARCLHTSPTLKTPVNLGDIASRYDICEDHPEMHPHKTGNYTMSHHVTPCHTTPVMLTVLKAENVVQQMLVRTLQWDPKVWKLAWNHPTSLNIDENFRTVAKK